MYNVEPKGLINLCKTPLENDYKNQLTFSNLESQINYFNSVIVKSFSEYTYIRTDNSIKVGANIDDIINCNYLFYRKYFLFVWGVDLLIKFIIALLQICNMLTKIAL